MSDEDAREQRMLWMRTSRTEGVTLCPALRGPKMRAGRQFGQQGAHLVGLFVFKAINERVGSEKTASMLRYGSWCKTTVLCAGSTLEYYDV